MHRGLWTSLTLVLAFGWVAAATAQSGVHTRVFRPAGSYPSVVSASPNGQIVAKSGDRSLLTVFDGFNPREIALPEQITYRVQQSRSGQIWCPTNDGLLLYHAGKWTLFQIPEIRSFIATPGRNLRQISILPAEVSHVLVLLPDRLLDFNATTRQTRVLKEAVNTGLGEFSEIQEGAEEWLWVSGTFGVAHIQTPPRHISPVTPWVEHLLPDTNQVNSLQRVFENPPGELTGAANPARSNTRMIARFRDNKWSALPIPSERIRQAWRGWDGTVWGFSTVSLFRVDESGGSITLRPEPVSGPQYDLAVEPNGVFWVAGGEGLIRYAPHLWRSPPELDDLQTSVNSISLDPGNSNVWLSTPSGLVQQSGDKRRIYPWPEELENLPPRQSTFRLRDGRILVGGQARPVLLDPVTGTYSRLPTPAGVRVHLLAELRDGSVCAWFEHSAKDAPLDIRVWQGDEFTQLEFPSEGLPRGELTFAREANNGDVWFCAGAGVLRFRRSTGTMEHHGADNGLRTDRVYAVAEVAEGQVWCGTASRIYEYRGQRWEPILNTQSRVTDIIASHGSIWVATVSGIHRYYENSWVMHGPSEGLPAGTIYTLRASPNEQIWAGTTRGVAVFHADADLDPPRTSPPVLDDVQNLSAAEPTLIHFHGQDKWDYTMSEDLYFSYRLDESSWTPYSNVISRVFHRLPAGNHSLEVRAMDRNGNKALESRRIEFAVILPWSKDPRLLVVLILALLITLGLAAYAVNKHLQLKRSYAEVEKIVAERTRELDRANQELLHGQKMRALGTMAAGIAHDFNNILSIIKGSAQIIENNVEDKEKIHTRVSRIQTVVEQGTIIVKALLGLGKTDQKELTFCDIHALLHQLRKLLSDRFPDTVQFQINVGADLPQVRCSPDALQQILLNLIINAVEAMHNQGVVELSASLLQKLPPKLVLDPQPPPETKGACSYVVISVIDEGGGITAENVPRIFEPFFTTKAFSSRRGTGLGLSMVYELAKGLGYGLWLETRMGVGSRFSVLIPHVNEAEEISAAGDPVKFHFDS